MVQPPAPNMVQTSDCAPKSQTNLLQTVLQTGPTNLVETGLETVGSQVSRKKHAQADATPVPHSLHTKATLVARFRHACAMAVRATRTAMLMPSSRG